MDKELQVMTASAKPSFGSGTDILDGVMVRLVTPTRGLIPPLMFYESGINDPSKLPSPFLHVLRRRVVNPIDLALPLVC